MIHRHAIIVTICICCSGACGTPAEKTSPRDVQKAAQQAAATTPTAPAEVAATPTFPTAGERAHDTLTYRIIDAPNGTYGYDILSDGRLFVHQTNVPGLPGAEGCKTKADAEKLAAFVIEKIQKGEMPPSITTEELKTLEIH